MAPRSDRQSTADTVFDRRSAPRAPTKTSPAAAQKQQSDTGAPKRRATSDGREPLVVYMHPAAIKSLKIAAVEHDTTASAIVTEAVARWLTQLERRGSRA